MARPLKIEYPGAFFHVMHRGNAGVDIFESEYLKKENDMNIELPLDKMSTSDKLSVMEKLWEDLCKDPDSIPSPAWHKKILEEREQEITEGKAKFYTLDAAKKKIKDQIV